MLAGAAPAAAATRDVLVVGNNWDGTADIVDRHAHEVLTRLNIVPDLAERMAEIAADAAATGFLAGIGLLIGEGHNQYVDDAFTSPDGRRRQPLGAHAAGLPRGRVIAACGSS